MHGSSIADQQKIKRMSTQLTRLASMGWWRGGRNTREASILMEIQLEFGARLGALEANVCGTSCPFSSASPVRDLRS